LRAIRESGGYAIAVSDEEMIVGVREIGSTEGIFTAPEGGAVLAALKTMLNDGRVDRSEQVVLFNTGSGHKYVDNMSGLKVDNQI
jgi:threonine synthase